MPKSQASDSFQTTSLLPMAIKAEPSLLATLRRLVEIESPSHDFAAVNRCVEAVAEMGTRMGATVRRHRSKISGDVLELRFASRKKGRPLLLLGHLDTVWPMGTLAQMPFRQGRQDGEERIWGPGVLDMKGGVAMALTALEILQQAELLNRPVNYLDPEKLGILFCGAVSVAATWVRLRAFLRKRRSGRVAQVLAHWDEPSPTEFVEG